MSSFREHTVIAVHGTKGRAIARYRADDTMPRASFERLTVTTAEAASRVVDLPAGQELAPLRATAMRHTVINLADAISGSGLSAANGFAALHTLETRSPPTPTPPPRSAAPSRFRWIPTALCTRPA